MRKNKSQIVVLSIAILTLWSCHRSEDFFQYQQVSDVEGWSRNKTVELCFSPIDTTQKYNIYLHVRHNNEYPYQNLWLFLDKNESSKKVQKDTLELFLADKYGKWLGVGVGALREITALYQENVTFNSVDSCFFTIRHAMRVNHLKGIQEVGLRVERVQDGKK